MCFTRHCVVSIATERYHRRQLSTLRTFDSPIRVAGKMWISFRPGVIAVNLNVVDYHIRAACRINVYTRSQ